MLDNLEKLETLSLRRNRLTQIGNHGVFTATHSTLKSLDLSENKLENLGQFAFKYLSGLIELNLSHNLLSGEHSSLGVSLFIEKQRLEKLNMSFNHLDKLKFAMLYRKTALIELDVSHNNITEIESSSTSAWQDVRNLKIL
jgi:Leucine-rich repeat (LRR) protein